LGSIGTWYMLDEMLLFFSLLKKREPNALFLFVTPEKPEVIFEAAAKHELKPSDFKVVFAKRQEVAHFLSASDFSVFFIKPLYSKISSSPTKLGELLAMGIPVVCNTGVGDVGQIIEDMGGGVAIDAFDKVTLKEAAERMLQDLKEKKYQAAAIREKAFGYYDLQKAVEKYAVLYQESL
ncbi:MAG: glycosyltransferase, partial [Chitinophagales bacterium]